MNTLREGRNGRRASERGATLIEFALILPIFMTMVFGMFSGGLAYDRKLSMTNAAAEASRYGATLSPGSFSPPAFGSHGLDDWLRALADAVEKNASSDLDLGVAGRRICVAYVHPNGTAPLDDKSHTFVRTTSQAGSASESSGPPGVNCFADGRPNSERRVQIEVRRKSPLDALFFKFDLTLTARSVTRFEATP